MERGNPLETLLGALEALSAWLETQEVPYVIVGGLAASLLGRPRMTRDIDALAILDEDAWDAFLDAGRAHDFEARIPDCTAFARESRVLLVRHQPSGVDVDLICAGLPYEEAMIRHGISRDLAKLTVRLPRPEDLILMKAIAQRPRDVSDIEGIVATQAQIDWEYLRGIARDFGAALDASSIPALIARIEQRHREDTGALD